MDQTTPPSAKPGRARPLMGLLEFLGSRTLSMLEAVGAAFYLLADAVHWMWRGLTHRRTRLGRPAIISQMVRVGVRSVFIIGLVSSCVGLILALQMAPPLDDFGSKDLVANITGVAIFRELGPLIASIVLTGFAGAAIAAEIGTMVVGEEIEALEAHALNPVRFLVVPRVIATVISMTCLAVFANLVAVTAGWAVGITALGIPSERYIDNMLQQVKLVDFLTGIGKATVFGLLIGLIACTNGLRVTGGAAGVGQATTSTVVQSIVAIIFADLMFTAIFYSLGWV
ncbi:MAG TPA: ABC transporter permease [Phycisphaerales bacterium]|nr:ABC transporter permease [Phycisphaerales bacterium]